MSNKGKINKDIMNMIQMLENFHLLQYFEFFSKVLMKPYSFYKLNSRAEKLAACFAIALKNFRLTYFETILFQNILEEEVFLEFELDISHLYIPHIKRYQHIP